MKRRIPILTGLALVILIAGCTTLRPTGNSEADGMDRDGFTYGYWLNGWKRLEGDTTPPVLAIEAQGYGLTVDLDKLEHARFGLLTDGVDFESAAVARDSRLAKLEPASLLVEVTVDGVPYRAKTADLKQAWMWESGQVAQHFDLRRLALRNDAGELLTCSGELKLVAWPDSLTLTAKVTPIVEFADGRVGHGVSGAAHMIMDQDVTFPHQDGMESETFTLEMWLHEPTQFADQTIHQWVIGKNENEWEEGCFGFIYSPFEINFVMNIGKGRDNQARVTGHKSREGDAPGAWKHLVGTYDGDMMRFYMNGILQGETQVGRKRVKGTGALRLGTRPDGVSHMPTPLKGIYDEVRIWNRALSAEEILAHHENPREIPNREGLGFEENFGVMSAEDIPHGWANPTFRLALKGAAGNWETKAEGAAWALNEARSLILHCPMGASEPAVDKVSGAVTYVSGQSFPINYQPEFGGHVATVEGLERTFEEGYVKITDYDEFGIAFDYSGETAATIPFLLDLRGIANITGLVPILCNDDGTPTGIHVQLSKNWHHRAMGSYLRAFAMIPAQPGANRYRLRIPYGFYGTLPSASHAQLCLIGYGGNQRWDQLALACGGEAITYDVDMSLTDVLICDVRAPLTQKGKDGAPWTWTDAVWGGDWLSIYDLGDRKLAAAGMKTAYLAHGPCLSDVRYVGAYGSGRDALLDARIQFARTNDYGRTFQQLSYAFQKPLPTANTSLMSKRYSLDLKQKLDGHVFFGNAEGLLDTFTVKGASAANEVLLPAVELPGPGPWWVSSPYVAGKHSGYISMVIRDFGATFGGKAVTNPFLEVRSSGTKEGNQLIDARIVPPPDVESYQAGDRVTFDADWLHLAPSVEHYAGLNEGYRQHLAENPNSWKTTYREVTGNSPKVVVEGGTLLQDLPIVIAAEQSQVTVTIKGGLGFIPIRFEGLASPEGYGIYDVTAGVEVRLDQAVQGNDFWQTDFDAASGTYRMVFNLPVDGRASSQWVLKR